MDGGVISHSPKEQKFCENQHLDIISNLPEHVLHYIISFLPTKDAIRLSILSTRWQYLWTSIPAIDLEDITNRNMKFKVCTPKTHVACTTNLKFREFNQESKPDTKFLELVNRILTLHDASDIKKLKIWSYVPDRFTGLNLWLQIAVNHNVEELDLELRCRALDELPFCLFTCHSLVVLKISAKVILNSPPFTSFLNIKKLSLHKVTFFDELSTQRLFSSCTVLDELVLKECNMNNLKNITIVIPTLKSLTIDIVFHCMIEITAINLNYLEFSSDSTVNICLGELPSLDNASVDFLCPQVPNDGFAYRARRLFTSIYNVKVLKITYEVLLAIIYVSDILDGIPTFDKLIHLEMDQDDVPCYNELMRFLMKTPKLENLDLFQGCNMDVVYEMLEMVPSCFNSSLKIFSISKFVGTQAEMELLGFVLGKSTVLQRLIIYYRRPKDKHQLEVVISQVFMLPKVSESCVIEFRDGILWSRLCVSTSTLG